MQLLALAALSIPSSPNPKSRAAVLQGAGRPWTPLLAPVGAAVTAPTGSPLFNLYGFMLSRDPDSRRGTRLSVVLHIIAADRSGGSIRILEADLL